MISNAEYIITDLREKLEAAKEEIAILKAHIEYLTRPDFDKNAVYCEHGSSLSNKHCDCLANNYYVSIKVK